jgi:hypothetical protein
MGNELLTLLSDLYKIRESGTKAAYLRQCDQFPVVMTRLVDALATFKEASDAEYDKMIAEEHDE